MSVLTQMQRLFHVVCNVWFSHKQVTFSYLKLSAVNYEKRFAMKNDLKMFEDI